MMKFFRDRRGANMVEYIILVGVVALLSIAAFRKFGFKIQAKVDTQSQAVSEEIDNE
ncbi:MAG: Flp family type IVb pilin [Myxococcaceae bacterium]|nr:MAG: Flp family type IVb pilin [Myxococcaceae bacterium]